MNKSGLYLRRLRDFLADFHPSAADARRVAADSGLDPSRISFQGTAQNIWFSLLEEARRSGQVEKVVEAARIPSSSLAVPRAIVLTALEVEYESVRAFLSDVSEVEHRGTVYEKGRFGEEWDVLLAETGPRNTGAAAELERAFSYFEPAVALFVGIAGGLKDVEVGDVVCATKVYGYESGKETDSGFRPRPVVYNATASLVSRARAEKRRWNRGQAGKIGKTFRVFDGPIAAGDKLIGATGSATAALLRQFYGDALAVEMEGLGFLQGAHLAGANALIVRGISDLLDGKAESEEHGSQPRASRHAAEIAFRILAALRMSEAAPFQQ